jgi:hypothetical protein
MKAHRRHHDSISTHKVQRIHALDGKHILRLKLQRRTKQLIKDLTTWNTGQSQKNYQPFDRPNPKGPYIPIKKDIE